MDLTSARIAVIGLGYVGLPLALAFGRRQSVVGFDIDQRRIEALRRGRDATREASREEIEAADGIVFTSDKALLPACDVFVVTVPTPVDRAKKPDLSMLIDASRTVGAAMRPGAVVVFESTVFPGCSEEICVPVIEQASGLTLNEGFFLGYSPERMNPGDREHRLEHIVKVTSGSTPQAAAAIDGLYASIIPAGTYPVSSIKVAEAAKVIENTQRDINIAFVNELSLIFSRMGINTREVLEAAGTKWNFLRFSPGLVGGHCVGTDPYYLTHKAEELGYHPEVILAGRRINDAMGTHAADQTVRLMIQKGLPVAGNRVLVMGAAFKENCPDVRNSKVGDIVARLRDYKIDVEIWDPWPSPDACKAEIGLPCFAARPDKAYDAVILAVRHREFEALTLKEIQSLLNTPSVIYDVKGLLDAASIDGGF